MSKRKRRKNRNVNLPEATLARARELAQQDDEADVEQTETIADVDSSEEPVVDSEAQAQPVSRRKRRDPDISAHERSRRLAARSRAEDIDPDQMERADIKQLLANPTKIVTEDDLRRDYVHVVTDLRSMGILAVILVVVLIAVNLILLAS